MRRRTVTQVQVVNGTRRLHEVDPVTHRDVAFPPREPQNGTRSSWENGYPFGSGFTVK